jgi:hypothetical protein
VPEPLARDEDRAADVEAEGVVLERRPVPVAHQEADQPASRLVHLVLRRREADARGVDDREVARHRRVERTKPWSRTGMELRVSLRW